MEDVLAILLIFGGGTAVAMSFSPVGRAIADRLRGRSSHHDNEELEALRDQVQGMQEQLSELAERQDFTERVVAQVREKGAIGSGPTP